MADARMLGSPPTTVVERAKAFLAGTLAILPLKLSAEAAAGLEASLKATGVEATAKVKQDFINTLALQEHYAGRGPVAFVPTPEGAVVLAVGPKERDELLDGLTDEELRPIQIDYPVDSFAMRIWPSEVGMSQGRMGTCAQGGQEMAETRTMESPPMTVVERAKAFLAGTLEIPPLKLSEKAAYCLEVMFEQSGVVPTEKARRQQTDALATQEHYAGKGPVACARTPDGIVVLAVGPEEVLELVEGLADEENLRLEIQYPVDPFMMRP